MRRSQPPPSPAPPCPPCPPPPSPPSGSSSPQAAGHQFSQEGRIFPKRAKTSRLYRRRRKAPPGRACPAPCSLVGCRSQARRRSGSRRSCRCQPSPARSTSAKCRGRNDWRNVEILGRKSRRIYGCYGAFPSFLKKLPRLQFTCGSGKAISEPKVPGTF